MEGSDDGAALESRQGQNARREWVIPHEKTGNLALGPLIHGERRTAAIEGSTASENQRRREYIRDVGEVGGKEMVGRMFRIIYVGG